MYATQNIYVLLYEETFSRLINLSNTKLYHNVMLICRASDQNWPNISTLSTIFEFNSWSFENRLLKKICKNTIIMKMNKYFKTSVKFAVSLFFWYFWLCGTIILNHIPFSRNALKKTLFKECNNLHRLRHKSVPFKSHKMPQTQKIQIFMDKKLILLD
jgi:hypothetical protein